MRLGQHREAGVDSVRRREAGVKEAEAGEQRVRFDDVFKGFGDYSAVERHERLLAVFEKYVPARLRYRHARLAAAHAGAYVVRRVGALAGLRFEPRRERVAHSGDEEAARSLHDDFRIDEHEVRVLLHLARADIFAVGLVDDRDFADRRVGRRGRRSYDDGQPHLVGADFRGVHRFAAAGTDYHGRAVFSGYFADALDLFFAALAVEGYRDELGVAFGVSLFETRVEILIEESVDDDAGVAVRRRVKRQPAELTLSLHVAQRTSEGPGRRTQHIFRVHFIMHSASLLFLIAAPPPLFTHDRELRRQFLKIIFRARNALFRSYALKISGNKAIK